MDDKRTPMEAEVQEMPEPAQLCPPGDSYGTAARPKPQRSYAWAWISVGLIVIGLCTFGVVASLLHLRVDRSDGGWRLAMGSTEETEAPEDPVRALSAPQTGDSPVQADRAEGGLRLWVEQRAGESLSPEALYAQASPAVVCVELESYYGSTSATGVVVSADGYILSASEGLSGAMSINVVFADGSSYAAARVGEERNTGVCLLKIEAQDLPTVRFARNEELRVGQPSYLICNPYGAELPNVFYEGMLSACQSLELGSGSYTVLQSSAQLREVGYGCPIFDAQGRVLGLTAPLGGGLSAGSELAVSAGDLVRMATAFDSAQSGGGLWLGLEVEDIPEPYLYFYGFPGSLWISQIPAGSALCEVLCPYDVITEIDGSPVNSAAEFEQIIGAHSPGDRVRLTIYRSGKWYTILISVLNR